MEQKEFIEVFVGTNPVLVSISSIATVERDGTGATIVLKELTKANGSYYIQTTTNYYTIKIAIENYVKVINPTPVQ